MQGKYRLALTLPDRDEVYLYDELCKMLHVKMSTISDWEESGLGGRGDKFPGFPKRVKTPIGMTFTLPTGKTTHFFWYKSDINDWLHSTGRSIDVPPYAYRLSDIKTKFTARIFLWTQGKEKYPEGFPLCHKTLLDVSYFYKHEVDEFFAGHPEYTGKYLKKVLSDNKANKKTKLAKASKVNAGRYVYTKPEELASPLMGFVVKAIDTQLRPRESRPLSYDKACFLQEAWEKLGYMAVTVKELREEHAA